MAKASDTGVELLTDDALVHNLKTYRNRSQGEPKNDFYKEVLEVLRKEYKKRHGRNSDL